jgi:hypothetical protein
MSNFIGKISYDISTDITIIGFIIRKHWKNNTRIYIAKDNNNNIITFHSNVAFPINQTWNINGKIKRHHIFNEQKQTHISDWHLELCLN